jgi:acyl-CoA reductase-like NAD-dependent aldehyde dehydrogenase
MGKAVAAAVTSGNGASAAATTKHREEIESIRAKMRAAHDGDFPENLKASWRIAQIEKVEKMVAESRLAVQAALYADLGKEPAEAMAETMAVEAEARFMVENLKDWMKPKVVPSPLAAFPSRSKVVPTPLAPPGVLVIGPSNYPFMLALRPAIGALAAGNPVLIKPSDLCPRTGELLQQLIGRYFGGEDEKGASGQSSSSPSGLYCVLADVPKTTELLSHPWGTVFFTGSQRVGKIVAGAAAQTLSPVVLELGGKSPCIVDETCPSHIQQMAHRIVWGKTLNSGQTCAAVDYVLVHESRASKLVECLVRALAEQYPKNAADQASELGRMVCREHADRQVGLIEEVEKAAAVGTNGGTKKTKATRIVVGGSKGCDPASRYVAPTVVVDPPQDCRIMKEEIFGPILPVLTYSTRREAIQTVQEVSGMAPLCLYVFTDSDNVFQHYVRTCRAGAAVRNDCLMQLASRELPFGGLGTSGYGRYHGKYTFDLFSHLLPVMYRPCVAGSDLGMARYAFTEFPICPHLFLTTNVSSPRLLISPHSVHSVHFATLLNVQTTISIVFRLHPLSVRPILRTLTLSSSSRSLHFLYPFRCLAKVPSLRWREGKKHGEDDPLAVYSRPEQVDDGAGRGAGMRGDLHPRWMELGRQRSRKARRADASEGMRSCGNEAGK